MISLLIALILYQATNLEVSDVGYFDHDKSTICPFGVIMAKIGIVYLILQLVAIQLLSKKKIRMYGAIFLIMSISLSMLNRDVFIRMIPVFILEYTYIFHIIGKDYNTQ
jgi:hypothetical protein